MLKNFKITYLRNTRYTHIHELNHQKGMLTDKKSFQKEMLFWRFWTVDSVSRERASFGSIMDLPVPMVWNTTVAVITSRVDVTFTL